MNQSGEELRNRTIHGGTSEELQFETWKIFQIMAEFVEGFDKMSTVHPAVSFFGSARIKPGHPYYKFAHDTARLFSESGFSVISGGGPGIMEAVNRGAREGGSPSIGLNIKLPGRDEEPNLYTDVSIDFHNFFVRKLMFVQYASAYVVMPGGLGTLDEMIECLTLMQTEKAARIPVILAGESFWSGLLAWLTDTLLELGTVSESDLELFQVIDDPAAICEAVFDFYETNDFNTLTGKSRVSIQL